MNAYEMPFSRLTLVPAVDFKDKRYTLVTVNAEGKGISAVAGGAAVGVIQEPNNVNEPAQVITDGVSFVVLGGDVAAGAEVEVGADGKAITLATGKAVGICLVGGAAGDIGSILL